MSRPTPSTGSSCVAVDELDRDQHAHRCDVGARSVSTSTSEQVLDLIFTVGCYQLLALAVNTLGIQPEDALSAPSLTAAGAV